MSIAPRTSLRQALSWEAVLDILADQAHEEIREAAADARAFINRRCGQLARQYRRLA